MSRTTKPSPAAYALPIVRNVCAIAGSHDLIADTQRNLAANGIARAVEVRDNAKLFGWLVSAMSYQGVADAVAESYMRNHGRIRAQDVFHGLDQPRCPKLRDFWQFTGCNYSKSQTCCAMPEHYRRCSLPRHDLRNGRLNQSAYSLALFIRDLAAGDLVAWIDDQLQQEDRHGAHLRARRLADALVEPMLGVYGISYKVLAMTLADLLLGGSPSRERWVTAGSAMIAIDTLVHNWLHRTGILRAFDAEHAYGSRCNGEDGCGAIITRLASRIDARSYNPNFPRVFPRFVQHAIWRFCARGGLDQCNGNRIADIRRCQLHTCPLFSACARVRLNKPPA